jgi:hypothetical protein
MKSRMLDNTKAWNPFKGCRFDCVYCEYGFRLALKVLNNRCMDCYNYVPHYHLKRLKTIPCEEGILVCGDADISFCEPEVVEQIIGAIKRHNDRRPDKTYFFQSKRPECFEPFLSQFPRNVVLATTLETNRDKGYNTISKAPVPSRRYEQFKKLAYDRKAVSIEPIMDFDVGPLVSWIRAIKPEHIWIGFNIRSQRVQIPEPSEDKVLEFMEMLNAGGIRIRKRDLRGLTG